MTARYVPLPKAARRLGVTLLRAAEMIREQQLRAKLSGGRWWVELGSLESLLRARRRTFGPPSRGAA